MIKIIVMVILAFVFLHQVAARIVKKKLVHFPFPYLAVFIIDNNLKRLLQPAETVIRRSGIMAGMTVLEIGCGSGSYTTFAAREIGAQGRLYALDIQQGMLDRLQKKLSRPEFKDLKNIFPVKSSAHVLPFDTGSFDLVYLVTVLQEIPDVQKALSEIKMC
ncbi:MAG: Menaquinone biosynthesis methyltransferase (2-heptaprenyl-1, 4-naphthoquinone methyltransferase) [Desulfotomaculum sp. 46_80]|nr:MAG: Menaquinone biosynthesis methyltransferase (2-heptaprenyl-1, 4-naphthoquinone methyltransferase) [Desulfotomaculum sp. 46_80]